MKLVPRGLRKVDVVKAANKLNRGYIKIHPVLREEQDVFLSETDGH